jgi:hypothetical protein
LLKNSCHSAMPWQLVANVGRLVQICEHCLATSLLERTCYILTTTTTCQQVVSTSMIWLVDNKLATNWWNNKLVTTCQQACYKLTPSTTCQQDVRFLHV